MSHVVQSNRLVVFMLFMAVACGGIVRGSASAQSKVDHSLPIMRAMIERYTSDLRLINRKYPVPMSSERHDRLIAFYDDWMTDLKGVHFDALDRDGQVDHILLRNELARAKAELKHDQVREDEMRSLLPFADVIVELEEARRRMEVIDAEASAKTIAELVKSIQANRNEWSRGVKEGDSGIKPAVADRASRMVGSLRRSLREWFEYYDGYDPLFTWWVKEPFEQADLALSDYARLVREKLAGLRAEDTDAIVGDPIGREALLDALRFEMIPYEPAELVQIARREYDWCFREMLEASGELGFGDDWHAALEHVKTLHVKPGEQTELIRQQALEAIEFVESRDLLTVPELAKEGWRMEMMSPERQKVNPFFLGGESIIVSFPTDSMSHEDKLMSLRGNNPFFCRAVVHHELIPGHHLQGFMNDRFNAHRQLFYTPFWIEGWALYWEMLLWDTGFARTPEERIGMLFWRMHRCARIVFSLSFHLEEMTAQECIDYLVENVGHEYNNAEAEVRRSLSGDYEPLYQAAYMLGGLQFRAMHYSLVRSGRMTNREFHDAILRLGPIPVELVRASLVDSVKLSPGFTSSWKFYGEIE